MKKGIKITLACSLLLTAFTSKLTAQTTNHSKLGAITPSASSTVSWHRFNTSHGYIDFGPANDGFAHIYTNMPRFILNKELHLYTGGLSSYNGGDLNFKSGNPLSNNTRMTIRANGRVGIGTKTPNARLHVKEDGTTALDAHLEGFTLIDGAGASLLFGSTTGAKYGEWAIEYNHKAGGLNFWKPAGGTTKNQGSNYHLFIGNNGNIGMGTTKVKDAKLSVNGKIRAVEIEVSLSSTWADYVFEDNYELMSLTEVEKFVDENSHLPNVPSAKEVEKEGINIGDMNAILLRKIEELTLYLIELEKKVEKNNIK